MISKIFIGYFMLRYGKKISWGKEVVVNQKFQFSGNGKLLIGDGVNLWAHEEANRFQTYSENAEISLGKNTRVNGALFQCREKIQVGKNCLIGSAHVMDTDFHHAEPTLRNETQNIPTKKVRIGNNVWLAGQSAVLKGVEISDNAVVAFRAVVSKNIPENSAAAGNPAQVVKTFSEISHQ